MRPEDAQFGVTIDFVRGQSNPVQIFAEMTDLLRGFVELDRQLIAAILPEASPETVIEDIEAASITAWIRSALNKADDKAIESMDVKKAVGVYLVKAKYKVIEFLDDREHQANSRRKTQLLADLTELAAETPTSSLFPTTIDLPALATNERHPKWKGEAARRGNPDAEGRRSARSKGRYKIHRLGGIF